MIEFGSEPNSIDLLLSVQHCTGCSRLVGRKFGAVEQGEMKIICEHCSRTVWFSVIATSHVWLFEFN